MALKSTVYKAELEIVDMDRHYYETHKLTLARHPSETDERIMMRLQCSIQDGEIWFRDDAGEVQLPVERIR